MSGTGSDSAEARPGQAAPPEAPPSSPGTTNVAPQEPGEGPAGGKSGAVEAGSERAGPRSGAGAGSWGGEGAKGGAAAGEAGQGGGPGPAAPGPRPAPETAPPALAPAPAPAPAPAAAPSPAAAPGRHPSAGQGPAAGVHMPSVPEAAPGDSGPMDASKRAMMAPQRKAAEEERGLAKAKDTPMAPADGGPAEVSGAVGPPFPLVRQSKCTGSHQSIHADGLSSWCGKSSGLLFLAWLL